jgi:Na+/melibiose symporter-like transporter
VPRWRRVAGWVAYMLSALWLGIFLAGAYWHAHSWGWTYLMAAWLLWFAIFLVGIWLAEWCWKPSREMQASAGEEHPE